MARRAAAGVRGMDLLPRLRVFSCDGFQILCEEVRAAAEKERAGGGCVGGSELTRVVILKRAGISTPEGLLTRTTFRVSD